MSLILKKIYRIFLVSICILMPFLASAQKMEKTQIDKFTNDTSYFTTTEKIAGGNGAFSSSNEDIKAYASKSKGEIYLHLVVELSATAYHRFAVSSGNAVIIKLADNSIVNLNAVNNVQAEREGGGTLITGRMCWVGDVSTHIDKTNVAKMLSLAVVAIRVQTDANNLDFDIKSKDAATLTKMFQLIVAAN